MDQTFDWFSERGINLVRSDSDREYAGHIKGIKNVQLIFLSASEIPRELSSGRLHFGVTGNDVIQEKLVFRAPLGGSQGHAGGKVRPNQASRRDKRK